mmetsp:Transcript_8663/g.17587  ORF Transcript_8663/g.17587 Transcript_8663/m.17587 type:complete len:257 (-) Transcript_8663:228-998(-)
MTTASPAAVSVALPPLVIVTSRPLVVAVKVPSIPEVIVAAVAATAANVEGNSIMIFPLAGIGLPVVKASALAPAAPATREVGVTVGVTPLKMLGVNVTDAGKSPPVASSNVVPSFCVVLNVTQVPLTPAYFWFVIAFTVNSMVPPAVTVVPAVLVIVISFPLTAVFTVPSMPLERLVVSVPTAAKEAGNSIMIFPSLGRSVPIVNDTVAVPTAPATSDDGTTVGAEPKAASVPFMVHTNNTTNNNLINAHGPHRLW